MSHLRAAIVTFFREVFCSGGAREGAVRASVLSRLRAALDLLSAWRVRALGKLYRPTG